jgi:hypothetical protein
VYINLLRVGLGHLELEAPESRLNLCQGTAVCFLKHRTRLDGKVLQPRLISGGPHSSPVRVPEQTKLTDKSATKRRDEVSGTAATQTDVPGWGTSRFSSIPPVKNLAEILK